VTGSIRAGNGRPPRSFWPRLAAYPRQNALVRALREIGCLERTLFILEWISDPALRRRSNAGLNKGEARNALARALFSIVTGRFGTHLRKPALPCLRPHLTIAAMLRPRRNSAR
jgi:TnpA family transposase